MRHLDLFSGIGGFALATEMVWDEVEHTFCDIEPFSQAILKKHWPNSTIYGDIRTLTNASEQRRQQKSESSFGNESSDEGRPAQENNESTGSLESGGYDLLTGGFPCQPFSQAGRRLGTADDRHLWPEMLRVIREFHPRWVVGENVSGLLTWDGGLVLEQVLADLEAAGYEAWPFIIPAAGVGAPHRRERVWIIAHTIGDSAHRGATRTNEGESEEKRLSQRDKVELVGQPSALRDAADSAGKRSRKGESKRNTEGRAQTQQRDSASFTHTNTRRLRRHQRSGTAQRATPCSSWQEDWPEVAARLCAVDDGVSRGLARPRGWRNAALKGAGNAIVPQVVAEIFKAIKLCDESLQ